MQHARCCGLELMGFRSALPCSAPHSRLVRLYTSEGFVQGFFDNRKIGSLANRLRKEVRQSRTAGVGGTGRQPVSSTFSIDRQEAAMTIEYNDYHHWIDI